MKKAVILTFILAFVCSIGHAQSIFKQRTSRPVVNKTASYTLTKDDYEKVFTNTGATGPVTFTLPEADDAIGREFKFVVTVDQNIYVKPEVDDYIYASGITTLAAGDKLGCGKKGCAVSVLAISDSAFVVDSSVYVGSSASDYWKDAN